MAKKILFITIPLLLVIFLFFPQKSKKISRIDEVSTKSSSIKKPVIVEKKIIEQKAEETTKIPRPKEIENILAATNLWEDLKSIDGMMEDRLELARDILPPEEFEKLEKAIQENFSSSKFIEEIKNHLSKNLSDDDLEKLRKLTEDPFLKRVWELQTRANSPEAIKEMVDFSKDYTPTPEREKLAMEYEAISQTSKKTLELNAELLKGMFQGASPKPIAPEQLNMIASQITQKISKGYEKSANMRFHFAYQDLSDSELVQLIQKERDSTLTRVEDLIHEKLKALMYQGGSQMGQSHKGMLN